MNVLLIIFTRKKGQMKIKSIPSLLILLSCLSRFFSCYAATTDYTAVTWNMQGASSSGIDGSKWATTVKNIMTSTQRTERVEVLALQEAGGVPLGHITSIPELPEAPFAPTTRVGEGAMGENIEQYWWHLGTLSRTNDVYIYHTHVAGRLNLAIVSRKAAEEIFVFEALERRPVIGIRINNDYFFNLHAGAHPYNEAALMINAIEMYMSCNVLPRIPSATWMIMGDFNREPFRGPDALYRSLIPVSGIEHRLINTNETTHTGGRELDYALLGGGFGAAHNTGPAFFSIATLTNHMSDHVGVRFAPRPP